MSPKWQPSEGVNPHWMEELCTETLIYDNILSYILVSQPYTQVQGSILSITCLNIPQSDTQVGE